MENSPQLTVQAVSSTATQWQERLLPLMTRMLVGLTIFFMIASLGQLAFLHWRISHGPEKEPSNVPSLYELGVEATVDQKILANNLATLQSLELNIIERRYRNADVLLISRLWLSYLGFVTGMILSLVGAAFILGKLELGTSEAAAKIQGIEIALKSASLGLVLAALGVALMMLTTVTHHRIEIEDRPVYVFPASLVTMPEGKAPISDGPPPLLPPKSGIPAE